MQIPPEPEAMDGGSEDAHADEDADRRQIRERDLMRELDRMTGRGGGGGTGAFRPPSNHPERARPSRAEEVEE